MNNGDMPASPQHQGTFQVAEDGNTKHYANGHGLTKREHFAGLAMQGILANHQYKGSVDHFAECSVEYADALLKALENSDET